MSGNRGVVYIGAGQVEVQKLDYPKMQDPRGRKIEHGVILKVISQTIDSELVSRNQVCCRP